MIVYLLTFYLFDDIEKLLESLSLFLTSNKEKQTQFACWRALM